MSIFTFLKPFSRWLVCYAINLFAKLYFLFQTFFQTHPLFFIGIIIPYKFFLFFSLPYGADGKKTEELSKYFARTPYSDKTLLFSPVLLVAMSAVMFIFALTVFSRTAVALG